MRKTPSGTLRVVALIALLAVIGAACGDDDGTNGASGGEDLTGQIVVSGSSTVEPISALNAEKFSIENPGVDISVEGPGTGDGFELFCNGETDVSDASRPIDLEEEAPNCEKNGIEYIELKVGIDGLSVLTGTDNTEIECLDYYDLYALLGPESEGFANWSDANGLAEEVGAGNAPYPDVPLDVTAPGEESGTYDSFAELVLEDIAYEERKIEEDAPVIRPDYQSSPNDNVIIEGISGSASSLGWVGFAFYQQNTETVRAIPVDGGDGCVEPSVETIEDGSYPIARDLYVYVNAANVAENDALAAFVDFYLSEEGLLSVSESGYVDLPDDEIDATLTAWQDKATGSREG